MKTAPATSTLTDSSTLALELASTPTSASAPTELPVPKRRDWRRAFRAMRIMAEDPSRTDQVFEIGAALDGGDTERVFQSMLAEPGGAELLQAAPDLPARLFDGEALAALPAGSLGRAYLDLMTRNGFAPDSLEKLAMGMPEFMELFPGPARHWWARRVNVTHDLMHVVTGYNQEAYGELALTAFTAGIHGRDRRMFIHRFVLVVSVLFDPEAPRLRQIRMLWRAWRRGAQARLPFAFAWEQALALPLDAVRERLGITELALAHPGDDVG